MAHYLVSARPLAHHLPELEARLSEHAFVDLEPFGRELSSALTAARKFPNGTAVWEEKELSAAAGPGKGRGSRSLL
jgi:hypothetical protein